MSNLIYGFRRRTALIRGKLSACEAAIIYYEAQTKDGRSTYHSHQLDHCKNSITGQRSLEKSVPG